MAQKRMLNKSISLSGQVNKLSLKHKLLFTWCIPHLDDFGLIECDPEVIKAMVCPMVKDINLSDIRDFLVRAQNIGLVELFEDCVFFCGFTNHQSISEEKRSKSKFSRVPKNPQENIGENNNPQKSPVQVKLREDKRIEDKIRHDFSLFWEKYPKHVNKRKCQELWDGLSADSQQKALDDIPKRKADEKWLGGFIKDPERYIKHEQWNDDIIPPKEKVERNKEAIIVK